MFELFSELKLIYEFEIIYFIDYVNELSVKQQKNKTVAHTNYKTRHENIWC